MKIVLCFLFFSLQMIVFGQPSDSTSKSADFYIITEAYLRLKDTTFNLEEYFVKKNTFIFIMPGKDSTIIDIDHGKDGVLYIGFAKKIKNPGFKTTRDDSEFYKWSYIKPNSFKDTEAIFMKEYITESLEKRGRKFYFFNIVDEDMTEYQIYGYLDSSVKK